MTSPDQVIEDSAPVGDSRGESPGGPKNWRSGKIPLVLNWLLVLAALYTLYFAKTILMPIVVALLFSLLLSPLVSMFKRFRIPRPLSAVLLMAMLGGPFIVLSIELAEPVKKWMERVPELSAELTEHLDDLGEKLDPGHEIVTNVSPAEDSASEDSGFRLFGWFRDDEEPEIAPPPEAAGDSALVESVKKGGIEVLISLLAATPYIIAKFMVWVILVLFLLICGPGLYTQCIELFPQVRDKRRAMVLVGRVRQELSRYILTVSLINASLGFVTGLTFWLMGVDDALLWGVMICLLNFAPYIGTIVAMCMLGIAGLVQYGLDWASLLPAAAYFTINLVEAQFVTPTILGRHMRLNPLILILWLLAWGWLWGPVGVLIAVPLLVCIKLMAAQLNILGSWVKLIETEG
tara:strand:- start:28002 stop:29216 length:1215 start_codon:yes stop_codon:yes gene_type:complete